MKQIGLEGEDLGLPFSGGNSSVQWVQGPTLAKNWPGTWYKVRISQSMHIQFALLGLMSGAMQMQQEDKTLTKTTLNQYQFINLLQTQQTGTDLSLPLSAFSHLFVSLAFSEINVN